MPFCTCPARTVSWLSLNPMRLLTVETFIAFKKATNGLQPVAKNGYGKHLALF